MNFVYIHRKKSYTFDVIEEFLQIIKTRYNLIIYFIRTDRKRILNNRYVELTRDITIEYSVSNTSKQNNIIEYSKKMIIKKIRCLYIIINLPINL